MYESRVSFETAFFMRIFLGRAVNHYGALLRPHFYCWSTMAGVPAIGVPVVGVPWSVSSPTTNISIFNPRCEYRPKHQAFLWNACSRHAFATHHLFLPEHQALKGRQKPARGVAPRNTIERCRPSQTHQPVNMYATIIAYRSRRPILSTP